MFLGIFSGTFSASILGVGLLTLTLTPSKDNNKVTEVNKVQDTPRAWSDIKQLAIKSPKGRVKIPPKKFRSNCKKFAILQN